MFDNTTLACARLAERDTTPIHEADSAAIKFFALARKKGISVSNVMTGDVDNDPTPSSDLQRQKSILSTENASLKKAVNKLETKASTLETRLAAARSEVIELRADNTKLRADNTNLRAKIAPPPTPRKIKAKDGFVPYGDFYLACIEAWDHLSGWKVVFAEIAGVNVAAMNRWQDKKQVPEKMLEHIPALAAASKDKNKGKNLWTQADRDELLRFYHSGPKVPTYVEMAAHMTAFTKRDITANSISGKLLGVPRRQK